MCIQVYAIQYSSLLPLYVCLIVVVAVVVGMKSSFYRFGSLVSAPATA